MLRFGILASAVPLLIAGVFTGGELAPGAQPCIALADHSVQIASSPWQAQLRVGFTDNPALATVRVQIVDSPESADFALVDDIDAADSTCRITTATRFVAIAASPSAAQPLILLTRDSDADYRIYVSSKRFSARDAAALVVGAGDGQASITTASIGRRS